MQVRPACTSSHAAKPTQSEILVVEEVKKQGEEMALDGLPVPVRNTVFRFVYLPHLEACRVLKGCSSHFTNALLSAARIEVFTCEVRLTHPQGSGGHGVWGEGRRTTAAGAGAG